MNKKSRIALAALALLAGGAALAQDSSVTYNVGVVSDYRFRGIEQSAGQPSVQAGIDFAHKGGFYAGAWAASNIKWIREFNGASKGSYELDLYGGFKGELAKGLGFDVGVITYQYPGNDSGDASTLGGSVNYSRADTTEAYVGLSYSVVSLKYFQSMGDFLGNKDTNGSRYWDLSATFDLGNGFTLTPHYGLQTLPTNSTSNASDTANYSDYALTLAKDMGNGLVVSLAAIGTDAKRSFYTSSAAFGNERYLGKDTVVLGLKYNF
jgi:uncharacterized protein (TIGR02001 family)